MPALQVEVADTTGAGDAFVAGLSHALAVGAPLQLAGGAPLQLAVQAAARVAAWTVSHAESVCRDMKERLQSDPWEGWDEVQGL